MWGKWWEEIFITLSDTRQIFPFLAINISYFHPNPIPLAIIQTARDNQVCVDDICASWSPAGREAKGLPEQSQALPEAQPVLITRFGFHTDANEWNPRASMMQTTTPHTISPTARHRGEYKPVKSVGIISLGSEPELGAATRAGRLPAALQVSRKEVEVPWWARRGSRQERQDTVERRS